MPQAPSTTNSDVAASRGGLVALVVGTIGHLTPARRPGLMDRYAADAQLFGTPYGVFATADGAVFRHHDITELRALLNDLDFLDERPIDVVTMNDHRSKAVQLLARKP